MTFSSLNNFDDSSQQLAGFTISTNLKHSRPRNRSPEKIKSSSSLHFNRATYNAGSFIGTRLQYAQHRVCSVGVDELKTRSESGLGIFRTKIQNRAIKMMSMRTTF
ncbi:hypothetical protein ACS0TY_002299 [Phlomoides rotata]